MSGLAEANTIIVFVCLFQSDYAYLNEVNSTDIKTAYKNNEHETLTWKCIKGQKTFNLIQVGYILYSACHWNFVNNFAR